MAFYTPVALKLHAFGLQRLQDPNWTGMELFDQMKRPVRREGFLQKFQKEGFLYWLGNILFRDYMTSDNYVEDLDGEYMAWYLDDFCSFLLCHGTTRGRKSRKRLHKLVTKIDDLLADDEDKYYRVVDSRRMQEKLVELYRIVRNKNEDLIEQIAPAYAANYADRVFHDRELCGYLSQLLVSIGFDGMDSPKDTEPRQWMDRVNIPVWAKELVTARDRGLCAQCRTAITMELEADDHFDHMVPLSRGGCNDIVNLQLLCQDCNLKKSDKEVPIHSSIPPYLRRYHRDK